MMDSTTRLTLNLQYPNIAQVAYAMQGDRLSRAIVADLIDGSTPWAPPAGAHGLITASKPDGTFAVYDTLEDGSPAVVIDGSTVTLYLAEQVLADAGAVKMSVAFFTSAGARLTTFRWTEVVAPEAVLDRVVSGNYISILTATISQVTELLDETVAAALKAEGFAVGEQDGEPVASGSPYYQNNSKYFSQQAENSAELAGNYAQESTAQLPTLVSNWLGQHITQPTTPAIDNTLSVSGAAADAAKTGALVAPVFSELSAYSAGDYVLYNGQMYRFTVDHAAGAWAAAEAQAVDVAGELGDLTEAITETNRQVGINTYPKVISSATDLLTKDDVKTGDIIHYHFIAQTGKAGYIEILSANGTRIEVIGKASASSGALEYEGSYTITGNFGKAVANTNGILKIDYFYGNTINEKIENVSAALDSSLALNGIVAFDEMVAANVVLFTKDEAPYGSKIEYSFYADEYYFSLLLFFDSAGQRIAYIGKPSSRHDGSKINFKGTAVIPDNFYSCELQSGGNIDIEVDYIKIIKSEYLPIIAPYDLSPFIDNRLPNPFYTTPQKENIEQEFIYSGGSDGVYRIPTVMVSNNKTILAVTTNQQSGGDSGWSSIQLRRKPFNGEWSSIDVVMPKEDANTARYLNPSLLIDRTGAHGTAGRIYLFAGKMLSYTKLWSELTTEQIDIVYKYSDDDGVTWSDYVSLKSVFDTSKYTGVIPAPDNGIQLADGTLVVPCMLYGASGGNFRDSLLYKKVNGDWTMSNITPWPGYSVSECSAIQLPSGALALLSRKDVNFPSTNVGEDLFIYDFTLDTFSHIESSFYRNNSCKSSVVKVNISNTNMYLKTYIDTLDSTRQNITIWVSKDCMKWIRVYRLYTKPTRGYGSISVYDGVIAAVYEGSPNEGVSSDLCIGFQDLSGISDVFTNSIQFLQSAPLLGDIIQQIFNRANSVE